MEPTPEPARPGSVTIVSPRAEEQPSETFFNIPYDQAPGLEALSAAATSSFQYIQPSLGDAQTSTHQSNKLNFILNPTRPESSLGTN